MLPTDCIADLEDFSLSERGELFTAVLLYADRREEPKLSDRAMKIFFRRIKNYIDSANENYEKRVKANRINGAKGGRPKKETEENPKNRTVGEKADTESDTESESDIDSESEPESADIAHTHMKKYGENGNVELTEIEYKRLAERMGVSKRDEYIEKLGDYMASTGKTYKSHYATIRNWFRQDGGKKAESSFDMDEFCARGDEPPIYKKSADSSNDL